MSVPAEEGLSHDLPSHFARIASAWFVLLGLVGVLLVGFGGGPRALFWMEVDSTSSMLHLAIGLVGVAMSTTPARARRFTIVIGPALVIWALLALVTDGSLGEWASGDTQVVAMHLLIGLAGIAVIWVPPVTRIRAPGRASTRR
ncbi:MAG: DUF4383 domain-containing protein [Thermoleophilia bacterium]|nr:DUF4383 domain-containing protein [Thermoleophilia bacterium]MDH3725534.1 DUF4383 domain-containing protein [Thermoleophilia bacterium]